MCFVICRISDKRRCANAECSAPISLARTLLRYNADDERLLSFPRNVKAKIFSKEAGDNPTLWEAEENESNTCENENYREVLGMFHNVFKSTIDGKRGYVPKGLMREDKVYVTSSELKFIVPTGRDTPKHNETENIINNLSEISTPELPVANSKGLFSTIGGVSADSVPPSSPDIKPQSTRKYQVFDGTTIYDDPVTETPDDPAEVVSEMKETPPILNVPSVEEIKPVEEKTTEEKPVEAVEPIAETGKKATEKESEASSGTEEPFSDLDESELKDLFEKFKGSEGDSSLFQDFFGSVSNFISSGSGAIEEEEEAVDKDSKSSNKEGSGETPPEEKDEKSPGEITSVDVDPGTVDKPPAQEELLVVNKEVNDSETVSKAPNLLNTVLNQNSIPDSKTDNPSESNEEAIKVVTEDDSNISGLEDQKQSPSESPKEVEEGIGNPEPESSDESKTEKSSLYQDRLLGKKVESEGQEFVTVEIAPDPTVDVAQVTTVDDGYESTLEVTKSETESDANPTLPPQETEIPLEAKSYNEDHTTLAPDTEADTSSEEPSEEVAVEEAPKLVDEKIEIPSTESPKVQQEPSRSFLFGSQQIKKEGIERLETTAGTVDSPELAAVEKKSEPEYVRDTITPEVSPPPIFSAVPKIETASSTVESEEKDDKEVSVDSTEEESAKLTESVAPEVLDDVETSQEMPKEYHVYEGSEIPPQESYVLETSEKVSPSEEIVEEKVIEYTSDQPSEGMFEWLKPVFNLFGSSDTSQVQTSENPDVTEVPKKSVGEDPFLSAFVQDQSCLAKGVGEQACEDLKEVPVHKDVTWQDSLYAADVAGTLGLLEKVPLEVTIWLIITAVVVLIFSLGHYYIEAHRRDGPLVAIINKLEREVLILKKESSILEDRLNTAQQELEAWNTNSSKNDEEILDLRDKLEKSEALRAELEEQNAVLEREVEAATESGLEMHRLLSESLSSQDGSQVLLSTVESLREKLEHQEDEIVNLSQSLNNKNEEVEELQAKLAEAAEVARGLEDRVIAVTREKEEEALQLKDKHRQLIAQLEEAIETKALDETRVSTEMSRLRLSVEELQKSLAEKDAELDVLKEVVKQLRSTDSNDKMDALFDVVAVRAQLQTAISDRNDFRERFQEEEGARKLLEGHMKKITQEVAELKNSFEAAEKEKIEALTKLQVLSNYFKEKESQLQKELGLQESMWLQKQSDDHTIYEQMRSLREENEKYKLQNESLKKEIVEQESSFKIQLANVEQKAHENWVVSRQAERKLKEAQQEAAQLRNRLTTAANFSLDDSKQNISESNGDPSSPPPSLMYPATTSPPFMLYPPGDFVPPPPLMSSPYPSDSRPPPLGRISSPPLDHRFSPPPPLPYPPYDYPPYGHHSPSPPPPLPPLSHHRNVHKPQPREMSREQKEHGAPTYSPDTDKPTRRNKR